jgi:hypothetical protein
MVRVVRPGGIVATYMWDMIGGGFPLTPLIEEMRATGLSPPRPPSREASRLDALHELWSSAGLKDLETREITVQRTFVDFDDFWSISMKSPSLGPTISAMAPADAEKLKGRVRARLPEDKDGRITHSARANAIKGRRPA